jgi:hypothetical protein
MTYTDATPSYFEYTIYASTGGSSCTTTYDSGSPITVYSDDSALAVNSKLYTNTSLTTLYTTTGLYVLLPPASEGTKYDYMFNNSGTLTSYGNCDV